ncbi:MAG: hypothetical protein Q8R92_16060 [Deltaproteobacteria bacterium]|nr:hypothetical protein [Deltaproteobacteria bacterium]
MKLLEWLLKFFQPPRAAPRPVKFLEGTEWICPHCGTTLAIARRDIYHYDVARSSDWDVKDFGFWFRKHCDAPAFKYGVDGRLLLLTPTGWVG